MSVKIKFIGGAGTVTGSSHLVSTEHSQVLLDSGLFQGHRDESFERNSLFPYNPRQLSAIILSHAHIDHCGNLPNLIKKGARCKVYATAATRDLCRLMLEDSGKIQEEDVRYVNKINRRLGLPMRKALYTLKDAQNAARKIRPISYGQRLAVTKDVAFTLYDAGHILGSAIISLEMKAKNIRLGYAVDLGRKGLPMLNDPVELKNINYLILESTYGGKSHPSFDQAKGKLQDAIIRTIERKGKIIVPTFSLERTQEVIYLLSELVKERAIPPVPVYVDSPLATSITDVFESHPGYMNQKTAEAINVGDTPFEFLNLRYVHDQNESKSLNNDKRPMVIIAGSGMCESGRILHHLKNNIEDSRNTILVVGYMAKNTLGKKIVDRERFVRIFGVEYELNAEVATINAFSGHADQHDLVNFVEKCLPLRGIFLVHGDPEQSQLLAETLKNKGLSVMIPASGDEVILN